MLESLVVFEHFVVLSMPWQLEDALESATTNSPKYYENHPLSGILLSELNAMFSFHDQSLFVVYVVV